MFDKGSEAEGCDEERNGFVVFASFHVGCWLVDCFVLLLSFTLSLGELMAFIWHFEDLPDAQSDHDVLTPTLEQ